MTAIQLIKAAWIFLKVNVQLFYFLKDKKIKIGDHFEINDILAEKIRKIPEIISVELS
jgi:hypothetical protein